MSLRYRITKRNNSINNNKEQYILQAVNTGTVDLEYIAKLISNESSLHEVDVRAVLIALGMKLEFFLTDGKIVDLGEMGRFKMGFSGVASNTENDLTPKRNIKKYHVNYQPSRKMKRLLKAGVKTYKEGRRAID
ncbi:DNA-binding protein [Polaribacter vadi]|uniref:DNA-binding protein n=1 Tax=Polaribacter vadi TaxID=1774273 RepID=A0A1B8TPC5_9FLAO|nr:HU family DNA-binding protein [Polaribacter vadi]AOW19125.1 DNA-binding protein [Polaribacter vadi]OBY61465.1 DNA-binding protein [Polaribacter vadi]